MVKKALILSSAFALLFSTGAFAQTDAALTAKVKTSLAADSAVKASTIDVSTADHVVTLQGTVATAAEKERALALVRSIDGVTSVVDDLKVGVPEKTTAEKAASGVEKGADKGADALGTAARSTAKATDKAIDKTGEALGTAGKKTADGAEKATKATGDALGTAAKKTGDGVSKAAKVTADTTTDAAITSAVKTKLLGDGTTPGLKINVDTKDGIVTLTGTVENDAAKAEALRLARTTSGVHDVVDKLTVGGK